MRIRFGRTRDACFIEISFRTCKLLEPVGLNLALKHLIPILKFPIYPKPCERIALLIVGDKT